MQANEIVEGNKMKKRKTSNWKEEYSTSYLRKKGARKYKIISTDKMKYCGWHLSTIFTANIHESILKTRHDLSKIKVIDEEGSEVIINPRTDGAIKK